MNHFQRAGKLSSSGEVEGYFVYYMTTHSRYLIMEYHLCGSVVFRSVPDFLSFALVCYMLIYYEV